jgi:hypothetical protein
MHIMALLLLFPKFIVNIYHLFMFSWSSITSRTYVEHFNIGCTMIAHYMSCYINKTIHLHIHPI